MPQICVWRFCRCFLKSVVPPEFPLRGDTLPGNVGWTSGHFRPAAPGRLSLRSPGGLTPKRPLSWPGKRGYSSRSWPLSFCHCITFLGDCQAVYVLFICAGISFRAVKTLFSGVFLVYEYRIGDFGGWIRGFRTGDLFLFLWRHQIIPVHFACFNPAAYVSDVIHCVT